MRRTVASAAALMMLAASAFAQTGAWTGPDAQRRPNRIGQGDLDFALSELCFPFLMQDASIESIANRQHVSRVHRLPDGAHAPTFRVGQADVMVELDAGANSRACTVRLADGNPERYREALDRRMAQWPTPLQLGGYQYPPNDYARREFFCGPRQGPHDTLLISTGDGSLGLGTPSMMLTLTRSDARNERCDGVRPVDAPAVNPSAAATEPGSPELRAFGAMALCRRALVDRASFATALEHAGAIEAPQRADRPRGWVLPGPGNLLILLYDENDCGVGVTDADPLALRQTVTENVRTLPGVSRGNPSGMPLENWAAVDLWCVRDQHGLFGILFPPPRNAAMVVPTA